MEDTLENKEKFFALHWGQLILMQKDGLGVKKCIQAYWEKTLFSRYLELNPLSSITDEDTIEVAKIVFDYYRSEKEIEFPESTILKVNRINKDIDVWFKDLLVNINTVSGTTSFCLDSNHFLAVPIDVYDYLRSKGYALPWMGLSVEELVSLGWVKLKS